MKFIFSFLLVFSLFFNLSAQQPTNYYLPDIRYDENIPSPESVLGYQIGEWHLSHDQLVMYMRALADASPRVSLYEYARSYEQRPLFYLAITSEENQGRLEEIRQQHLAISDPGRSSETDINEQPVVLYQGFSIHGNEASGGNAAPLVAYYLAAGQSEEVLELLENAVVLLDPCFNPDGFQRFSSWVNMHKNKNLTPANEDREYDEAWPGGRTNHYWFDLNRDWLLVQHPESQGRIDVFHQWKPNVLTDHHEMGTDRTFFFMPGIPQRTNPITPPMNQELTGKIGTFHAQALDEIGSLYYSRESFDDFYYGKGSTYPDANGCIGILFEQASARGHLQESENGHLSFPFAIRNQVRTALSTQKAGLSLRKELLEYQQSFYESALKNARSSNVKAYVFGSKQEPHRTASLVELLRYHQIEVYELGQGVDAKGTRYEAEASYIVPVEQTQYRLIRGIFETRTRFQDSIFYDVSSWTLPLAFGLPYDSLDNRRFSNRMLGEKVTGRGISMEVTTPVQSSYAYLLEWNSYLAPRALNHLMSAGLRAKVASKPFALEGRQYAAGTVMIPVQNQPKSEAEIYQRVKEASGAANMPIIGVATGAASEGIDLGSPSFQKIEQPKTVLIVGEGVSSYESGEVWHLLDQRYDISVTKVEWQNLQRADLHEYNTLIMVDGSYSKSGDVNAALLSDWVKAGGTLIASKGGALWADKHGIAKLRLQSSNKRKNGTSRKSYGTLSADRGSMRIGGAIVRLEVDLTHPLFYGFQRSELPALQRGDLAFQRPANAYAAPAVYAREPLLSGYIKEELQGKLSDATAVVVGGLGSGKTICMSINPNFRAFWYGTNRLFANSLFFGSTISAAAVERASGKK
jgi:hypothetical protein